MHRLRSAQIVAMDLPVYWDHAHINLLIRSFLQEDIGSGDISTISTIPSSTNATATFLAKADGVLAGTAVVDMVFQVFDESLRTHWLQKDGDFISKGTVLGSVEGNSRSIVTAERLALNLLQRMSGIATLTKRMVDEVLPPDQEVMKRRGLAGLEKKTQILDTRKTAPGLRIFDKYAVLAGGGVNHRFGLFDMVMIKDNHITAAGGIKPAVAAARQFLRDKAADLKVEVEARTLEEVKEVLEIVDDVDRVMLDNMVKICSTGVDTSMLEEALVLIGTSNIETEASGNVTLDSIGAISRTGVDYVSTGALTHSVTAMDISLKIKLEAS